MLELEYYDNILHISLKGRLKRNKINQMRKQLYYLIGEYGIDHIAIDISETIGLDRDFFYHVLDEYDLRYGGNLEVVE